MLYDGLCPICVTEIQWLQFLQRKKPEKVDFIDISLPGYDGGKFKEISYEMAMEEMHVIDKEDKVSLNPPASFYSSLSDFQCLKFPVVGCKKSHPVCSLDYMWSRVLLHCVT